MVPSLCLCLYRGKWTERRTRDALVYIKGTRVLTFLEILRTETFERRRKGVKDTRESLKIRLGDATLYCIIIKLTARLYNIILSVPLYHYNSLILYSYTFLMMSYILLYQH